MLKNPLIVVELHRYRQPRSGPTDFGPILDWLGVWYLRISIFSQVWIGGYSPQCSLKISLNPEFNPAFMLPVFTWRIFQLNPNWVPSVWTGPRLSIPGRVLPQYDHNYYWNNVERKDVWGPAPLLWPNRVQGRATPHIYLAVFSPFLISSCWCWCSFGSEVLPPHNRCKKRRNKMRISGNSF